MGKQKIEVRNLERRIMNLEEEVKKRFGGRKDVIIPAKSEAEFQQKKAEYLKTHKEPARFVFLHIIYDENWGSKRNFISLEKHKNPYRKRNT